MQVRLWEDVYTLQYWHPPPHWLHGVHLLVPRKMSQLDLPWENSSFVGMSTDFETLLCYHETPFFLWLKFGPLVISNLNLYSQWISVGSSFNFFLTDKVITNIFIKAKFRWPKSMPLAEGGRGSEISEWHTFCMALSMADHNNNECFNT